MLVALVNNQPGWKRGAAIGLLSVSVTLGFLLCVTQLLSNKSFGCVLFGFDFINMYASARLVAAGEGDSVYVLDKLKVEHSNVLREANSQCETEPAMPYWLAFLVPVLPFTLLSPRVAYYSWTVLSISICYFAFWRLARVSHKSALAFSLIGFGFLPSLIGFLEGQIHAWLLLGLTEFWLAFRRRARMSAGLWLSPLLAKPQFLPLIVLYVARQRSWRILASASAACVALFSLSIGLGGPEAARNYMQLIGEQFTPASAAGAQIMVNWRALLLLSLGPDASVAVYAGIGILTLSTVGLIVWWSRRHSHDTVRLAPKALLILTTAALLAAYDTHIHSAILVLPPALLFLSEQAESNSAIGRWSSVLDVITLAPPLFVIGGLFVWPVEIAAMIPSQIFVLLLISVLILAAFDPKAKLENDDPQRVIRGSALAASQ